MMLFLELEVIMKNTLPYYFNLYLNEYLSAQKMLVNILCYHIIIHSMDFFYFVYILKIFQ